MDKKTIQNFINELQTMADGLEIDEAPSAKDSQSVKPLNNAVTPYATEATDNRPKELHCYKSFDLPENISVQADILKKNCAAVFDFFSGVKTFTGYKPVLIYNSKAENTIFGQGINLNITEKLEKIELTKKNHDLLDNTKVVTYCEYVDALGDRYKYYEKEVAGMSVSLDMPVYAENSKKVQEFFSKPVHTYWLTGGGLTKVFDIKGRLVYVIKSNVLYTQIYYDESDKITKIIDGNEEIKYAANVYDFKYNASGYVSEITEARNKRSVSFGYSGKRLNTITYPDGKTLTFSYGTDTVTVKSSNGYVHKITSNDQNIKIISNSSLTKVPDGVEDGNLNKIVDYNIDFGTFVGITDIDGNTDYYRFYSDGTVTYYYKEENSLVTYAEMRRYRFKEGSTAYWIDIFVAPDRLLNRFSHSNFTLILQEEEERNDLYYDENNRIAREHCYYKRLSDRTYMDYQKEYIYSDKGLLTKEQTLYWIYTIFDEERTENLFKKHIVDYGYDEYYRLIKKSSYFIGEEDTKGKSVEEYDRYEESGYWIEKVVAYNSLKPKEAFVTETTYDLWGNVLKQTDSTGLKYNLSSPGSNFDEPHGLVTPNQKCTLYEYENGRVTGISIGHCASHKIGYTKDEVTGLSCNKSTISFGYDNKRRLAKVNIDGNSYNHYSLTYPDQNTVKVTNAKGESYTYEENRAQRCSKVSYGSNVELQTDYKYDGRISEQTDSLSNETVIYNYTQVNKLQGYSIRGNNADNYYASITYEVQGRVSAISQSGISTISYSYAYEDGLNGKLNKITAGNISIELKYDKLGRNTAKYVDCGSKRIIGIGIQYKQQQETVKIATQNRLVNRQSGLPSKVLYTTGDSLEYTYDDSGNITEIKRNENEQISYTYDTSDRLIRENNQELGKSYFYTYDSYGNISVKKTCAYTTEEYTSGTITNYIYDKDRLLSYNGENCVYDDIGNPTTYRGKSATWKGRQLQSFNGVTFGYDGRGRRITKNGVRYYYDYEDKLIKGNGLEYYYDHIGVAGFKYGGDYYMYKRDIQNNVIGILDSNGNVIVEYKYDAWGNHKVSGSKASTIGALNPFRYRSYFYDIETGFYFLQTRYYDPETGRFLNMDSVTYADPEATNGLNLYVYCGNNPVMNVDPTGCSLLIFFIFLAATATAGAVYSGVKAANEGKSGWDLAGSIFLGASIGLAFGGATLVLGAVALGAIGGAAATIFGVTAKTIFTVGALAFDFTAFVIAPLYGFTMQAIEYEPAKPLPLPTNPQPTPPHPYSKKSYRNKQSNFILSLFI